MAQTKQQREVVALVALVLVGGVIGYGFFGKNRAGAAGLFQTPGPYKPIAAEDYGKPLKDLDETRGTEYKPSGRNIFIAAPPPPPPSQVAAVAAPEPYKEVGPVPPPPPPAPVLDMKFFGLATPAPNGPKRAFLQEKDGDEVHIVGEGDTIKNHIRITHIGNDRIEFEDINTGMKSSANLEMPPPQ